MGIRDIQKEETRKNILEHTKELLYKNGFIKVSTKEISKASNVSQGSIFLHFTSKDNLLLTIFTEGMQNIELQLKNILDSNLTRETFLKDLLDVLSIHENLLSRIYKDYFYLDNEFIKLVEQTENHIKNKLFDNLRVTSSSKLNIIDSFISIDAFLSQIKQYLIEKDVVSEFNSVLKQKRGKLIKLYKVLFGA
jgi:AcrR family transcriptional regulator